MASCESIDTRAEAGTAATAVLAAVPGAFLTAMAASSADSLMLYVDLLLTAFDMLVLVAALAFATRVRPSGTPAALCRETRMCALVASCMLVSMSIVAWAAYTRIADAEPVPTGPGLVIGLAVNCAYAIVNLWILLRWHGEHRRAPSAFARSQLCLFCDKLSTNLLIVVSLATVLVCGDRDFVRYVDPVASLLIVVATIRWTVPVLKDALRGMWAAPAARQDAP